MYIYIYIYILLCGYAFLWFGVNVVLQIIIACLDRPQKRRHDMPPRDWVRILERLTNFLGLAPFFRKYGVETAVSYDFS